MKCPKCGYLGFEPVDRCRNCGYDFALTSASESETLELPLRDRDQARQSSEDLAFLDVSMAPAPPGATPALPTLRQSPETPFLSETSGELPLFGESLHDDVPLITKPSPPRPPLAVRRSTPDLPRLRTVQPRAESLDLGLESPPPPSHRQSAMPPAVESEAGDEDAPITARFAAVVTDLLILAVVDVIVVYFTLEICGVALSDLGILPRIPLFAFLIVQNGGYLVAFTAGGQTLGKMAAGIKVVAAEPRVTLDFGRAFIREAVWLVLAAPAGLGLLTVFSRDHRGVHDRFAGTRVVRA
jgi:uncharacterized RDD family membrane protein YckC